DRKTHRLVQPAGQPFGEADGDVLNHEDGDGVVGRQVLEQTRQYVRAAGRSAHPDHRRPATRALFRWSASEPGPPVAEHTGVAESLDPMPERGRHGAFWVAQVDVLLRGRVERPGG